MPPICSESDCFRSISGAGVFADPSLAFAPLSRVRCFFRRETDESSRFRFYGATALKKRRIGDRETAGLFVFFPLVFQFFKVLSCRGFRVVQGFFESFLLIFHLFDGGFLSLFDLCQLIFREIRFYLL